MIKYLRTIVCARQCE